jgi:small-conductance mechanosensitive channel
MEVGKVANDYMEEFRKLLEDEKKNNVEKEKIKAVDELQAERKQAIRNLLEDDIKNDVEKEMRKAADELLAVRRQAINELLKEQRQVVRELVKEEKKAVWAKLEGLRDSISHYSLK